VAGIILRILLQILINCALVAAVFLAGAYFMAAIEKNLLGWIVDEEMHRMIVWGGALIISLPFLIATYRKLDALGMLLAELVEGAVPPIRLLRTALRFVIKLIPVLSIAGILMLIAALSTRILPPLTLLLIALAIAAALTALLWKFFVRLHARLQLALFETIEQEKDRQH
jgi:CPA2 family monovalent cation:H+ antiporter-2